MNDQTRSYELIRSLRFMITAPDQCSYLSDRESTNLFVDPEMPVDMQTYSALARQGFRRSGEYIYRPHCSQCRECLSLRVDAHAFRPSRSQKRIIKKNKDLQLNWLENSFNEEHFSLYQRYMTTKHPESSMNTDKHAQFENFVNSSWCTTRLMEIKLGKVLVGVAVTDSLVDGLSAVYTFYEPSLVQRSLGTYSILMQIQALKSSPQKYLYLGYWIQSCQKMAYKSAFQPSEYFNGQSWLAFSGLA